MSAAAGLYSALKRSYDIRVMIAGLTLSLADRIEVFNVSKFIDRPYFLGCRLTAPVTLCNPLTLCSVACVIEIIAPLKIINAVICFDFVFMIYLWKAKRVVYKGHCDKPVNRDGFSVLPFPAQAYRQIAFLGQVSGLNLAVSPVLRKA